MMNSINNYIEYTYIGEFSHSKSSRIVQPTQKQSSVVRKYREIKEKNIKSKKGSTTHSFVEPNLSENIIPTNLEKSKNNERAMSSSSHSKLVTNTKNKIIERLKDKNFKKFYEPVLMNTTIISKAIHSKTLNKNRGKATPYLIKKPEPVEDKDEQPKSSKNCVNYTITDLSIDSLSSTKVRLSDYAKALSKDDKISSLSNFLETNKFESVFTKKLVISDNDQKIRKI